MQLSIISWGSTDLTTTTDINNGTDFSAWYDAGQVTVPERSPIYSDRPNRYPKLAGVNVNGLDFTFKVRCLGTFHTQRETIKRYFSPESFAIGTLTFQDSGSSDLTQWYVKGMPIRVNEETPGIMAVTLSLDEPYLRTVSETTSTWTITATGQSTDVTVTGNLTANPTLTITPTSGKAGDYQYSRWVAVYNTTSNAFTNYPFDFGGIDTAALVAANKVQSDGDDLRLRIDGNEVYRWFGTTDRGAINTTDTAVWASMDLDVKTIITLTAAVGTTDLEFRIDNTASGHLGRLKQAANKVLYFASGEACIYSDVNEFRGLVTIVERGAKGTTAGSHSLGDIAYHVPFDAWLVYGSSDATAQTVDDTKKPIIDLNSTNTSWIYSNFFDSTSPERPGQWSPVVSKPGTGKLSVFYTATQATNANPASVMGMTLKPYFAFSGYRTDNAEVRWNLHQPAGVTAVEASGKKYRYSTGWATTAGLYTYNPISRVFEAADNQATPSSDQTWTAFTIESTDTGLLSSTRYDLSFVLGGSIGGSASNSNSLEIDPVTLSIDSNGVPTKVVSAEQSKYRLAARITNGLTGDYIDLDWVGSLNVALVVDCDAKTVMYNTNEPAFNALKLSSHRGEWLPLKVGSNTLTYAETGAAGLTIGIDFENRNTL